MSFIVSLIKRFFEKDQGMAFDIQKFQNKKFYWRKKTDVLSLINTIKAYKMTVSIKLNVKDI